MSLLFKAELRGHKEPMAQVAFVMEDLKKGLSEEIMNLFRRKRINIGDIDELPIGEKWQEKLSNKKFADLEEDIPRTSTGKKDWSKLIITLNNYIEVLDELLDQEETVKQIDEGTVPPNFPGIEEELVEGYKQNKNIFKRIQSTRNAMEKLIPKLQRDASKESQKHWKDSGSKDWAKGKKQRTMKIREKKKDTKPLHKELAELLQEYSKNTKLEYVKNNITTLDRNHSFFEQRKLSNIWERYDNGELKPHIFGVLNDEYNGVRGIDLLKKLVKRLGMSTTYLKDTKMTRVDEYTRMDFKNEIDKLTEIIDDDANIDTTRQLFSDKKYPLTKIEDIADKLEDRLYDLDEGEEPVYSYDDEEIDEDILNTEMSKLVKFYSLLYYVADLRGKSLNSKMLNWEGHEVDADSLPEKFPIITDTYNALQEEE